VGALGGAVGIARATSIDTEVARTSSMDAEAAEAEPEAVPASAAGGSGDSGVDEDLE
jgi:hypothetical protein